MGRVACVGLSDWTGGGWGGGGQLSGPGWLFGGVGGHRPTADCATGRNSTAEYTLLLI